jgi:hypothetical protein
VRAVDVLIFLVLIAAITWGTLRLMNAGRGRKQLVEGRWTPAVHSLPTGGYNVVVECPGETAQVVRQIPAGLDGAEFSTALAEARSDAEEHAAALNAAR